MLRYFLAGLAAILLIAGPASAAPRGKEAAQVAAAIDREIDARLATAKVPASPPNTDAEFLRRATVDLLGRTPTPERVRAFLADTAPDKRRKLIDELLASPEFGRYFGALWYDLLVKDVNQRVGPEVFENWLADGFNANRKWDATVREILTAAGKLDANPSSVVWFAHAAEDGKQQAKLKPNDLLGTFAQKFLGQRLQCAECHNHPFTKFKQDDFWAAAALVSRVTFKDSDRISLRKDRAIPTVVAPPAGRPTITVPEKGRTVTAKFPDGSPYPAGAADPRAAFAAWVTSPDNPAFSQAMANRAWGHLLGRGFVNPVDDFRDDNPPSHPEALRLLSAEFVASGFDLKHLIRCVCETKAYQRSSDPVVGNAKDDVLFSHGAVRPMNPGVMFHAFNVALGKDGTRRQTEVKRGTKDRSEETAFSRRFKGDDDEEPELTEYAHGVPQVLWLMNGGKLDGGPTAASAVKAGSPEKGVELLYFATLSRRPTAAETTRMKAFVAREADPAKGYALALWALLNSSEFLFNH